jgi:hypothetical protein
MPNVKPYWQRWGGTYDGNRPETAVVTKNIQGELHA